MNIFIKPGRAADGSPFVVRDMTSGKPLADAGEWKERSTYWLRRLRDGDVVITEPPSVAVAPAADIHAAPADTITDNASGGFRSRSPRAKS